ncbi:hypothetical protein [Streptomyces sp. NPDC050416]|uniref:hypothetical protein n=1 Tax=Streptomyces sp. NPDC050416 TaxID=3365611 RepID=UPI0037BB805B
MPSSELDLRLDGDAADERTEEAFWHAIAIEQDMLTALAEHHTPDGSDSWCVNCTFSGLLSGGTERQGGRVAGATS